MSIEPASPEETYTPNQVENWDETKFRRSPHGIKVQIALLAWRVIYVLLFRTSPRPFHAWRRMILRLFGAKIAHKVRVYPSARIWAPWNLEMHENSCLGEEVDCYCVDQITIGKNTTVSQRATLCAATHDFTLLHFPLTRAPVVLGEFVWIAAEVFVMPGVTVNDGTVIGVRSLVTEDMPAWKIATGSPCKVVRERQLQANQLIDR